MGISELRRLPRDGLDHARMLMAETGNGGAAGAIENPPAVLGNEPHALATDSLWRRFAQASMQHPAVATAHALNPSPKHIVTLPQGGFRSVRGVALSRRHPART